MSANLVRTNYPYEDREFIANSFIIGNGRIGYKGTMDEETALDKVTFNVVGVYDKYEDKWRESLNLFNPLFLQIINAQSQQLFHYRHAEEHQVSLLLEKALCERKSTFSELEIRTERFIHRRDNVIASRTVVNIKENVSLDIVAGIEQSVYEINGPHYEKLGIVVGKNSVEVRARTNEGRQVRVALAMSLRINGEKIDMTYDHGLAKVKLEAKKNDMIVITRLASVMIDEETFIDPLSLDYDQVKEEHENLFRQRFLTSRVLIDSPTDQSAIDYALYHLLILENMRYRTSIPARGLSGQVYKGAIFWDTEVFMLPFYVTSNPLFARNLIEYRINTLDGAIHKAKTFGYQGAYYAWESQDDGREQCSLYNVTDAKTNRPIRTYFADKQIHISADVIYGLKTYLEYTDDYSILEQGGFRVIEEVFKFYQSYATLKQGKYHFLDVVGPDEYHERVDDNAFTNYHIYLTFRDLLALIKDHYKDDHGPSPIDIEKIEIFISEIYLPPPNQSGIIEQFSGYFALEDISLSTLKSRVTDSKAYLGGSAGLATPTRIIKQADVVALFALHFYHFDLDMIIKNYEFYEPYTEHGSSLSSSAYGLISARIGALDKAYQYFYRSATIDLSKNQKLYAGGIFIGGTHPASSGGAYNTILYGFLGARIEDGQLVFSPQLPHQFGKVTIQYWFKNTLFKRSFTHD